MTIGNTGFTFNVNVCLM